MRFDTLESVHQRLDRSEGKAIKDSYHSEDSHYSNYSDSDDELGDYGEIDRSEASAYKQHLDGVVLAAVPRATKEEEKADVAKKRKALRQALGRAKGGHDTWEAAFKANPNAFQAVFQDSKAGLDAFKKMKAASDAGPLQKKKKNKKNNGGGGGKTVRKYRNGQLHEEVIYHGGSGHGGGKKKNRRRFNHVKGPDPRFFQTYDKASKTYRDINIDELLVKIGTPELDDEGHPKKDANDKTIKQFVKTKRNNNGDIVLESKTTTNRFGREKTTMVPKTEKVKKDDMKSYFDKAHAFMKAAWTKACAFVSEDIPYADLIDTTSDNMDLVEAETKALDALKWSDGVHVEHGRSKTNRQTFNTIEQKRAIYYFIIRAAMERITEDANLPLKIKANVDTILVLAKATTNDLKLNFSNVKAILARAIGMKGELEQSRAERLKNKSDNQVLDEFHERQERATEAAEMYERALAALDTNMDEDNSGDSEGFGGMPATPQHQQTIALDQFAAAEREREKRSRSPNPLDNDNTRTGTPRLGTGAIGPGRALEFRGNNSTVVTK